MKKTLAIATVLMAAALTGMFSTSLIVFAQDESETNSEQEIAQKNIGSGESDNNNCAQNSIDKTRAGLVRVSPVQCSVTPPDE